jgi:hypothetical protein
MLIAYCGEFDGTVDAKQGSKCRKKATGLAIGKCDGTAGVYPCVRPCSFLCVAVESSKTSTATHLLFQRIRDPHAFGLRRGSTRIYNHARCTTPVYCRYSLLTFAKQLRGAESLTRAASFSALGERRINSKTIFPSPRHPRREHGWRGRII